MKEDSLIAKTVAYVRDYFVDEGTGHDWWHIYRVWQLAKLIARREEGDLFLIEMAALLHDLDDWKLSGSNSCRTGEWLSRLKVEGNTRRKILQIIEEVSFKGAEVNTTASFPEACIVQDADRLDAMGAIGIARTFSYGGSKKRLIYNPAIQPERHHSFSAYQKSTAPTINHFYEKLLLLKDRMNTETGKEIAMERHKFMEAYLEQFFLEWNVETKY